MATITRTRTIAALDVHPNDILHHDEGDVVVLESAVEWADGRVVVHAADEDMESVEILFAAGAEVSITR